MEPIRFGGAELAVVGGLMSALAGTVGALWLAYTRAVNGRIMALVQDRDMLRAIAWEAVELATALVQSHSPEEQSTPEQRAKVRELRHKLLRAGEAAVPMTLLPFSH